MGAMSVVRFYPPGGPEKLKYEQEDVPSQPGEGEILVKVHNPIYQTDDVNYKTHIPGHDFSGVVADIGPGVDGKDFSIGAEVYAFTSRRNHEGALAEYTKADADQAVLKPKNLNFAEAASVPLSTLTAWQALFDHGKLKAGQKLLVAGAAGGTGIFAVQFAKMIGAHVIATGSSPRSRKVLEGLGMDEFINYKEIDLDKAIQNVDLILDCVGDKVIEQCFKIARSGGLFVSINTFDCQQRSVRQGVSGIFFTVSMNSDQLSKITKLLKDGRVHAVVDMVIPLQDTGKAFETASAGHVHGKVVIQVAS